MSFKKKLRKMMLKFLFKEIKLQNTDAIPLTERYVEVCMLKDLFSVFTGFDQETDEDDNFHTFVNTTLDELHDQFDV